MTHHMLFSKNARPRTIEAGEWERPHEGPRVLIEHPDQAVLSSYAAAVSAAGFDVAACPGPVTGDPPTGSVARYWQDPQPKEKRERSVCPILAGGRCGLAEGADVIVTTTDLPNSEQMVDAHGAAGRAVVVESTKRDVPPGGTREVALEPPVTTGRLLDAVRAALQS